MDIKAVDRERTLPGNKGGFTNSSGNVFHRNTKVSRTLFGDLPKKSSNFFPKNSSVSTPKPRENTVCKYWTSGHCARGDKCCYLHSWSRGDEFAMLAKLEGHKKVQGVALPSGSDKLYFGSSDGTARIWDCNTGQCAYLSKLRDEVGSLITEGPWALNIHTADEFSLKGPFGQVYAMVAASDMLFAGAQNGVIIAWKGGCEANSFQVGASLEGHTDAVLCLTVGEKMLFSGSVDQAIRGVLTLCGMNDAETKPVLFCSCNDNTVLLYSVRQIIFKTRNPNDSKRSKWPFLHRGCNWLVDNLELAAKASRRGLMIVTPIVTASLAAANTIFLVVHYRVLEMKMYNSANTIFLVVHYRVLEMKILEEHFPLVFKRPHRCNSITRTSQVLSAYVVITMVAAIGGGSGRIQAFFPHLLHFKRR
ncbi:hypothetical protein CRYUN_Cryun15aG0044600 [Craigia yunnanensis]